MTIEMEVRYTYKGYKDFYWFSLFRGKNYRRRKATFPFITALMIALTAMSFAWFDNMFTSALYAVMSIICILFYVLAYFMPKQYVRQSPALFQSSIRFVFEEDSFSSTQTSELASGTSVIKYEAVTKVYETKSAFYLYITPVQAFLLSKEDFVNGTSEELRKLLEGKLPKGKYIVCR